jgi:hypothetical protein
MNLNWSDNGQGPRKEDCIQVSYTSGKALNLYTPFMKILSFKGSLSQFYRFLFHEFSFFRTLLPEGAAVNLGG